MPCYALDGLGPVVDPTAYVHPTAVLIGDVIVGANCYVGPCACLRGDFGRIELQAGANVQDTCVVHSFPGGDVLIEENGHIGHGAVLHGCVVKRDALVGMNAVVMDGAEVGAQSIVAACAFVPAGMKIAPRSLVVGAPARMLRTLSEDEIMRKREGTLTYQVLTVRCLQTLREVTALPHAETDRQRLKLPGLRALTTGGQGAAIQP